MTTSYKTALRSLLTADEKKLFQKLSTPQKIQDYLEALPINFEYKGETYYSPRKMMQEKTAHCFEGAVFAAAVLAFHGEKPLLMDFQTVPADEDHVIALYKQNGFRGAISKTNHSVLRFRDPVYASPRELAMSYFHEYLEWDGNKSLRHFSGAIDLSKYSPERWVTAEEHLFWLVEVVDKVRHYPAVPSKNRRFLRPASPIELRVMKEIEWKPGKAPKRRPTSN